MKAAMKKVAGFLSLVLAGLFAGFLVGVLVLELSVRRFDGVVYAQVRQVELAHLDDLAAATLIPALVATAVVAVLAIKGRGRAFWLTLTTLVFNLPINADQLNWDVKAPPADWASVHDRWQIAHAVRTGAAMLAFGCLSAAAMSRSSSKSI